MTGSELASLDVLGPDEQLRAAARAEGGASNGDAQVEGRDASRAVTVRIDATGRVSDVLISNWWRDDLTPSGLQDALLAAYQAAAAHAATIVNHTIAAGAPSATVFDLPTDEPVDEDDVRWLEGLRRRLGQVQETLDRSDRLLHTTHTGPEREVSGPAGLVRLVLHGRTVAQVCIDVQAAVRESPNRLAADALAAFQAIH